MGTELASKGNPFARRLLPTEASNATISDVYSHRVQLNSYSPETIEPNNARLHIKILKNAMLITEKKMREATQQPSRHNLGKLLDSIQEYYVKSWTIHHLLQRWQSPPVDINPDQINRLITHFENHFIHFLVLCKPSLGAQQQDLFFMCVWYLNCKNVREEKETANFLHICRKSASLFLSPRFDDFNQVLAKERLTKPTKKTDSINTDDLSLMLFVHLAKICAPNTVGDIRLQGAIVNIKKQLDTDPLFESIKKEDVFRLTLTEIETRIILLTDLDTSDELLGSPADDTWEFSLANSVACSIGFHPYLPSVPSLGLKVLEQMYRHAQLPDVRQDIHAHLIALARQSDPINQSLFALFQFLAGDTSDTHIKCIVHEDLKLYLQALIHYLQGQWPEAEKLAEKSQWREASWLLGQLHYRQKNLSGAIACTQKAVDFGLTSVLLQLVNFLLESPASDQGNIECLLEETILHHQRSNNEALSICISHAATLLQLAQVWEVDDLFSPPPSTGKKKSKGKKRDRTRPSVQYLTTSRLAHINLLCIDALYNQDYDRMLQLLTDASQKISWGFQQAILATTDLWRLAAMTDDQDYLHLLHHVAVTEDQSLQILPVLRQDSELLRTHGLGPQEEDDNIKLTDSVATIREKISNYVIRKSIDWLCFLHDTPEDAKEQWRQAADATAKQQMENFEYSTSMTFITTFLLTIATSVLEKKACDCLDPEQANQYRHQSMQFSDAGIEFNNWYDRLNSDDKLRNRIEAATPLGSPQKLAKTPPKEQNLASGSSASPAEKPEQQPRSNQSDTQKTVERMVADVINHTTSDADDKNGRPEGPERDSDTTVV